MGKISKRDLIILGVFCVFLLYFCAIALLNVVSLINDGQFYGFNPILAFTPQYIIGTLVVFGIVLAAIIFSVSSTIFGDDVNIFAFFKKEKGGDGYARWCTEKEMKKEYKIVKVGVKDREAGAAGVVFVNDGKEMWVDNSENHTLVIGVTGSGKTTAVVDPLIYSLIKHGESMIITDPKGEIYKNHGELLRGMGYNIILLNFREPQKGNAWNPLTLPYQLYNEGNVDKAIELVDDVAKNIASDPKAQDPFWGDSSADYFAGCTLALMEDAKEEEVNINSISLMTTVGEDKCGATSNYIKEYFLLKGEKSSAYTFASNTINAPNDTKGSILSTFRQKIRVFATKQDLSEMLAYSDFDMRSIGKEKTAVFMVIHDEKTTYHALATIFIKQCYETLISVAQENGGPLPVRTNFILDEFANMPRLKDVTTMVTAARSRQIRFTFIIQNFAQLKEVYGEHDAETIRSNCGNLMYLLTTELAALEEISKLCGEVKSKKDDKTASQPLVTVSDLQKMKFNEVIILRNRCNPFKTQLKQGFNTDWGDSEFGKAEFFDREKQEINLFDIKKYVDLRKNSKKGGKSDSPFGGGMSSPFSGGGMGSPFGGGGMGNPFGGNSMGNPFASSGAPSPFSTPSSMGGNPFASGGGMSSMGLNEPSGRKVPTFEEFLAAKNREMEQPKGKNPAFNIEDLVKRIDAKIAELEEQEKAEKEAALNGVKTEATPTIVAKEPKANPFNDDLSNDTEPLISEKSQTIKEEFEDLPFKEVEVPELKIETPKETIEQKPSVMNFKDLMSQNGAPTVETNDVVKEEKISTPSIQTSVTAVPTINIAKPETPVTKPEVEEVKTIETPKVEEPIKESPIEASRMTLSSPNIDAVHSTKGISNVMERFKNMNEVNNQPKPTNFNDMMNGNSPTSSLPPKEGLPKRDVLVDTDSKIVNGPKEDIFYDDFFDNK